MIFFFTGTTNGGQLISYEDQTLTLTEDSTGLLDPGLDDSKVLLKRKNLVHSQRWMRTTADNGYFQLKSLGDNGKENGKALTLGTNGMITVVATNDDEDGKF